MVVFRGLQFESDAEIGQFGHLWMGTGEALPQTDKLRKVGDLRFSIRSSYQMSVKYLFFAVFVVVVIFFLIDIKKNLSSAKKKKKEESEIE